MASPQVDNSSASNADVTAPKPVEASYLATEQPVYMPLHDPKNQLSSLVKNAQKNRAALQQRNEAVKQAKERSKRQYGW